MMMKSIDAEIRTACAFLSLCFSSFEVKMTMMTGMIPKPRSKRHRPNSSPKGWAERNETACCCFFHLKFSLKKGPRLAHARKKLLEMLNTHTAAMYFPEASKSTLG